MRRRCAECSNTFVKTRRKKYCTKACKQKRDNRMRRNRRSRTPHQSKSLQNHEPVTCFVCGRFFIPTHGNRTKYCGYGCQLQAQTQRQLEKRKANPQEWRAKHREGQKRRYWQRKEEDSCDP